MSEGDVSLIHDEDLLRRMWQQTEDFSRKKEIRAHMYRLREERLRNLYSPEPPISDGKGCEFTSAQGHVKSFADQTFQSMKSKEVRDAGSPPKEFTYRGQDLKELSNAGWNVESENRTTDDGHTHLKTVHANIEGRYDVDGGRGQFTAVDTHAQAVTEYQDQNTSVKRNESSSDTAAREQVVRQTDDGTQFSSITSSSTSSSKFQQVSSTKHETVPYLTNEDYDLSRRTSYDSQRNEDVIKKGVTKDCEQSVNRQIDKGELMSRKVEYPDENTKIIVETRCLPDGTRVTSTRREFRAPMVESTRTEHHTQQTRNESKSYQTSSQQKTRTNESVSQTRQQTTNNSTNIVDSQRFADVNDFKQNQDIHYSTYEDTGNVTKKNETNINEINKHEQLSHENYQRNINQQQTQEVEKYYDTKENKTEEVVRTKTVSDEYQTTYNSDYSQKKISQDWSPTHQAWASTLRADSPMSARPSTRASSPGSSTFQSSTSSLRRSVSPDKTCRKPPSRGGSPSKLESKSPTRVYSDTYRVSHSTQSISETKTNRYEGRPPQGRSPTRPSSEKTDRKSVSPEKNIYETTPKNFSPDSQTSIKTSQTNDSPNFDNKPRHTPSPDRRSVENYSHPNSIYRSSSPSKPHNKSTKASSPRQSPTRELIKSSSPTRPSQQTFSTNTQTNETKSISPSKVHPDDNKPYRLSKSPERKSESVNEPSSHRSITSPDKKPNYMKPTAASQTQNSQNLKSVPSKHTISQSPDRESPVQNVNTDSSSISKVTKVKEDHYKFIDEETKMYTHTIKNVEEQINISNPDFTKENNKIQRHEKSPSPSKQLPSENEKVASNRSSMRKVSRSPSPSKGPVTFEHRQIAKKDSEETDEVDFTKYSNNEIKEHQEIIKKKSPSPTKYTRNDINAQSDSIKPPSKETSPINYGTYDIKKRYSVETDEETITARKPSNNSSDSPTKKSPRVSTSPVKYGNAQRKTTSDFITIERSAEALNNKTSSKSHPRQLVTPSSSPTRKPKSDDTEPSTGQSSPTTSVSGFIYFSSPAADKTIVTDLDEQDIYTDVNEETEILCKRPENLRTSSPSKIPCRSPSPEKCTSPPNDKLPRKSSLKKIIPADDKSPPEKPPSNFRVSPAIDTQNHPEHKIVKKDRPDKPETVVKSKPPLERRETYEERCRKILGMMDDNNMISKKTKDTNVISNSPILTSVTTTNKKESLVQNTDIINTENTVTSGVNQKTTSRLSRDNSPTKLQDIISISQTVTHEKDNSSSKIIKLDEFSGKNIQKRLSASPEKGIPENNTSNIQKPPVVLQKEKPTRSVSPTKNNQKPISSSNNTSQSFLRQETYNVDDSSTLNNVFISKSTDVSPSKDIVETKRLRTPSPEKNKSSPIHTTEQLLLSEKEREILDRVQKSLRNLSPNRPQDNSSREQSPTKLTTSSDNVIKTQDDIDSSLTIEKTTKHLNKTHTKKSDKSVESIEKNITHKVPVRTPSPIKKPTSLPSPTKSPTDSSFTPRSISPKKSTTHTDRPQSPQVPKVSGTKREPKQMITKSTSPIKMDKLTHTINENKRSVVTNQSSFTKATPSKIINKSTQSVPAKSIDTEMKIKNVTRNINNQKHYSETKVTRAASDISIKPKKNPPQRMKSKPEIKVSEATTTKLKQVNTNKKIQIPSISQPNVPSKPKSATALNTPHDDDDIIIDVQQAKSSRESSPDRICPTPINYTDDISTPRYPDEINEPDDEFRKRTHHTLHEAESIVDDIVEICEDEELFVRNTTENNYADDSYDIRDNKVNKSNGILKQPKHITQNFKDTERNEHSDFIGQKLKSDECLLSVSQKVDKFARGVNNVNDIKISTRNVVDEYDNNTTYQDDYTKLSVNDKAHLFVETAENLKAPKIKPNSKVERPDLKNVDESLKTDDCLLSVSDKVNKFVKTAEQFLTHSQDIEEKERKINEQHDIIMKKILKNIDDKNNVFEENTDKKTYEIDDLDSLPTSEPRQEKRDSFTKETVSSFAKVKDHPRSNLKPQEKTPTVKITTMRSSEAVKKAKALFENIASTQKKDTTHVTSTKLTDIGVMKKSPKTDSTVALHPSEEGSPNLTDVDSELDVGPHASETQIPARHKPSHSYENKPRNSPSRYTPQPTHASRTKSPVRQSYEKITVSKSRITHSPTPKPDAQNVIKPDNLKSDPLQVPSYQRPTKTSQMREEVKITDETEVSSRRGSGKFGVELRRTSLERSTVSSERRRSTEHHQPCIEDIFDLDLLEQMLEKVVGYEQRRRIRAQIRIVKQRLETSTESDKKNKSTKYTTLNITQTRSPDRHSVTKSPDRQPKVTTQKPASPERQRKPSPQKTVMNHHSQDTILNEHRKESIKIMHESRHRPRSPEKQTPKSQTKSTSPLRQPSPEKKTRSTSPSKAPTAKPKTNRFSEYASAYLKKVGVNDKDMKEKIKTVDVKTKKTQDLNDCKIIHHTEEHRITETKSMTSKSYSEETSSRDVIEVTHVNGKRTPSPEKKRSPERKTQVPTERLKEKSPSPVRKRQVSDIGKMETKTTSIHNIEKNFQSKQIQEEKPSWVTNRNLKKITSENRTFSSKKIENDKPKYRAPSPSKVISRPTDVITSSYGPGPLDADGKPLFGIKALRNGATNYQVKGTVIRQEFRSQNGGEPEGTVSVTAYGAGPALDALLAAGGERPSRLHGLAAITTTRRFGPHTGHTIHDVTTKEERAALDQFTHNDRRVSDCSVQITEMVGDETLHDRQKTSDSHHRRDESSPKSRQKLDQSQQKTEELQQSRQQTQKMEERHERTERREDRKTVRQSSVKSLTEKFIKNASETSKSERSAYPKAGLILRTTSGKDIVSSDSSVHAGLARTDSEQSLGSVEDVVVSSTTDRVGHSVSTTGRDGCTVTTSREGRTVTAGRQERVPTTGRDGRTVTSSRDGRTVTATDRNGRTVTTTTTRVRMRTSAGAGAAEPARQDRSFLDSTTKVTGVQDILTRMRNADIVIQEGDSADDAEARALLNKFLGATVLMAGMQGYVADPPRAAQPETIRSSRVVTSVEELDLDQCWDERLLKKLLDECTDYEQRRKLRARIRSLMAEQEACAAAVTEALAASGEIADTEADAEATSGAEADAEAEASAADTERGESLLLPLLQGLLGGGGERLLAGLGAAGAEAVADVRRALGRLRAALAPPARHPQAAALLALADRLEAALQADRLDGTARAPRRRRTLRHTVGVTRAELAQARRLVDRELLVAEPEPEPEPEPESAAADVPATPPVADDEPVSFHDAIASRQKPAPIAHSASFVDAPRVNRDARVVERRSAPRRPDFFRHSIADGVPPPQPTTDKTPPSPGHHPSQPVSPQVGFHRPSDGRNGIAALANKFDARAQEAAPPPRRAAPLRRRSPPPDPRPPPARAPLYQPLPPSYNFAAPPSAEEDFPKQAGRFNAGKRARMKRANTVDIGRPLGYRADSDTDDDSRGPSLPKFQPQTENDRKFVAFMRKNQENQAPVNGHSNWSSRFGNIKNAFEGRDREERGPVGASPARRFWRVAGESPPPAPHPRRLPDGPDSDVVKPPWASERKEPRAHAPTHPHVHIPPSMAGPHPPRSYPSADRTPPIPQSPTRPVVMKPFVAKPIPVNQFSHAPMSVFKPPAKIASPTRTPSHVWSPPSLSGAASPASEAPPPAYGMPLRPPVPVSPLQNPSWTSNHFNDVRKSQHNSIQKYNISPQNVHPPSAYKERTLPQPPTPPTHGLRPIPGYQTNVPSNNNDLSAPELVRRVDGSRPRGAYAAEPPKVDAQRLQIEFYEKQIRERGRGEPMTNGHGPAERKPPPYTVTDYTPSDVVSTFVPLQQTPDIEKARAHKVDRLPDVVLNDAGAGAGAEEATEHGGVESRVMRGPVRGSATITAGVRTRGAADSLRSALDRLTAQPRPAPPPPRPAPAPAPAPAVIVAPAPAPAASRESPASAPPPRPSPARSPRRVVTRAKSMHLLAAPRLFEGGVARAELSQKRKTVEAYFGGAAPAPAPLARSRTEPALPPLLDEANADDAFEDLVSALA